MNVRLDRLVRRLVRDPGPRERAEADPGAVAAEAGVDEQDLAAVLRTDLAALHTRGVHPLLLMHLAGAARADPMALLAAPPANERESPR